MESNPNVFVHGSKLTSMTIYKAKRWNFPNLESLPLPLKNTRKQFKSIFYIKSINTLHWTCASLYIFAVIFWEPENVSMFRMFWFFGDIFSGEVSEFTLCKVLLAPPRGVDKNLLAPPRGVDKNLLAPQGGVDKNLLAPPMNYYQPPDQKPGCNSCMLP